MFCTNCGNRVASDEKFCTNCGTRLPVYTPEPTPVAPVYTPEPEPEPVVPVYTPEPEPEPIAPVYTPDPEPVEEPEAPTVSRACCEYKVVSCALEDLEQELNACAKEGWYVITCDPRGAGYVALLEREV